MLGNIFLAQVFCAFPTLVNSESDGGIEMVDEYPESSGMENPGQSQHEPCWSDLNEVKGSLDKMEPIGFGNKRKLYLIRLKSKDTIGFGTFCPSTNKVATFGRTRKQSYGKPMLLGLKAGSTGWTLTTQWDYQWRLPKNAVIVGKFAGSQYDMHREPTYYSICRPDLPSRARNGKLLLGLANSRTGLCEVEFGGQVVYFTRFHILVSKAATENEKITTVKECSRGHSMAVDRKGEKQSHPGRTRAIREMGTFEEY